jgi:hypothetical protein
MKAALLFLVGLSVLADVVTMKDGKQISGHVESGDTREIHIKVGESAQTIAVNLIQSIQFETAPGVADGGTKAFGPIPVPSASAPTGAAAEPVPTPLPVPARVGPQSFTLPAGTEIAIRTIDRIESKTATLDREYAASIDAPVVVNGATILPAHTKAYLRPSDINNHKLTPHPSITMALVGVTLSGQRVNLDTGGLASEGGSRKKRGALGGVIGATGGAAVGAVFGPVGAGVGAIAGGMTGFVIARVTGRGVVIPAEQRFTYKLTQPLVVNLPGGAQ